jgi:hypothetical protein
MYAIYDRRPNGCTVVLPIFPMGKIIIYRYILFEKISHCPLKLSKIFHIFNFLYTTIAFYIFDNTPILLIRPYTTFEYHCTTTKKTSHIELISTVGSLHIGPFLLHTSSFSTGRTGCIVYLKNLIL